MHDGLQSVQPVVAARHLEADIRHAGVEIARQSLSDRQHDREGPPRGERHKGGKKKQAIGINRGNAARKAYCPKRIYRRRHKVENFFCRIEDWRRIATRYDKLVQNFLAATQLVGALYWIKLRVQTLALLN